LRPRSGSWLRPAGLAAAGVALIVLVSAFVLLYLRVPAGHAPVITGWAPSVGALYLRAFPYPTITLGPRAFRVMSVGLVLAMWSVYAGAVFWTTRSADPAERRRLLKVLVAVAVLANVVVVLLPLTLSTDLYFYGLFGKMILAGGNPYLNPGDALMDDPLWPHASWTHLRSHYGPIFLWLSAATSWLGGGGPLGTALAWKAMAAALNLFTCWIIWQLARAREGDDGLTALALYALNPLALIEGPGNAHSEAVMIPLALLGILLWGRGRPLTGFATLLASAAVKYLTGVLALLAAVKMVAEAKPGKRLGTAGLLVGVSILVAIALYAPFWGGGAVFDGAINLIVRGRALERARSGAPPETPVVGLILFSVALIATLPAAARLARPYLLDLAAGLVTLFVLAVMWWRMPWYFVTAIALTVAGGPTRSNGALKLLALTLGVLSLLLYCALVPIGRR
jgi:hypothetical protein